MHRCPLTFFLPYDVFDRDCCCCVYYSAYPVRMFDGRKTMILATTNWIGGSNAFLSNAYLWFGVCCVLFSLLLAAFHVKYAVSLEFYHR